MAASHGTRSRYVDGCRCDDCTRANRSYSNGYKRRRALGRLVVDLLAGRVPVTHGRRACYARGCRRPECVQAARDYINARRRRMGVPTRAEFEAARATTHGRRRCYDLGCRRPECRQAAVDAKRQWRNTTRRERRARLRAQRQFRARPQVKDAYRRYPSLWRAVEVLTDPAGPAFTRLWADIVGGMRPEQQQALLERVSAGARACYEAEFQIRVQQRRLSEPEWSELMAAA